MYSTYITFGVHQLFEIIKLKNLWKTVNIFYNMPIHVCLYIAASLKTEFPATLSVVSNIFTIVGVLNFLVSRVMYITNIK